MLVKLMDTSRKVSFQNLQEKYENVQEKYENFSGNTPVHPSNNASFQKDQDRHEHVSVKILTENAQKDRAEVGYSLSSKTAMTNEK